MVRATEEGEVENVFTSHDRRIFAAVNTFFGGPVVVMRTIFENGVVVETVTRPKRGALPVEKSVDVALVDRLVGKMTSGNMPLWARQDRPQWGYHVELVDTEQPSELWQRHRQRIDELAQKLQTSLPPQDNLPLYIALSQRSHEITNYSGRWRKYIGFGVIAGIVVLIFGMLPVLGGWAAALNAQTRGAGGILISMAFAILLMFARIPLSVALGHRIPPLLPGPPMRPVADLLQEVVLS